jgi:hypothetical protein
MMNDIPNNLYTFRQRIDQSKQSIEVIKLIQEIDPLLSNGNTYSDAYDLLVIAFQALQELTRNSVIEAERLIPEYLLPYLVHDSDAPVSILSAISRLRECLIVWFDQYPEQQRSALRERVLNQLLLKLQKEPSPSICWIISDIGYRQRDIVSALWELVEHHDNDLGDTALATLTALGVPSDERGRLLAELHRRIPQRMTTQLIIALGRLADPSSFPLVQRFWLQNDAEQASWHRSLALRIITDIADAIDSEEMQDQIWLTIVDLFEQHPERFAIDIYLGSDIASQCNSVKVVPDLLRWIGREPAGSESSSDHRRLLSLRLENCVRPRQLQGWKSLPIPSTVSVLRQDACQDTRFEGRATTHEMLVKRAAWQTLLQIGYSDALNWFQDAVSEETNRYIRREMCDLFACFYLDPLPSDVVRWVTEPYDAKLPASSAELVARLGAIKVARSAASQDSFDALLACGLSVEGQNLRESADALEEVVVSLARAGNSVVVSQLVNTIVGNKEERLRTAAASALESLVVEELLPEHYVSQLTDTLLKWEERDPFERSMILAALGHLSETKFPKEIFPQLRAWARDRNDRLGIQSFMTLARQDDLLSHEDLLTKIGLKGEGETWNTLADGRYAEWVSHVIGLLYLRNPGALRPAVTSLLEAGSWESTVPIIWKLYEAHRGKEQLPLPSEIAEALVRRILQRQTQISAELGIFQVVADFVPERLAEEPWDNMWEDWLPDARAALADALGEATYISIHAKTKAVTLLSLLTGDGRYAIRRAAYRGLARQSMQSLQTLCLMWLQAPTLELRQRAAEAWAWLSNDDADSDLEATVYQILATDVEKVVRETVKRTREERRKRVWAKEYLARIRQTTSMTNSEVLAAWCYAQALTHVGDDTSIGILRGDLRTQSLPPHMRHWFQKIIKETIDNWEKAISKWPQPWRAWQGIIEEGQGWILLPDQQKILVHYSLWQERATTLSENSSWGGTLQIIDDMRALTTPEEITLQLSDERQGKALIQTSISRRSITIVGNGLFPV